MMEGGGGGGNKYKHYLLTQLERDVIYGLPAAQGAYRFSFWLQRQGVNQEQGFGYLTTLLSCCGGM